MCKSLLDPKTDYIFKQIFGQEDYVDTLISFLNALFKGKPHIKSLQLKNTEISKILKDNKTSRLDVRARTDNDIELDIEIQFKDTGEIRGRSLHYTANMFPQILNSGESYEKSRVIAIWILGENVTDRVDAISEAYMTFQPSKSDGYEILSENERIIYIELPKFNPKNTDKRDLLNGWLEFLQEPSLMDSAWMENREIAKAMDRLKYISADDDVRAIADLRQRDANDRISEKNAAIDKVKEKAEAEKRQLKEKAEAEKKQLKEKAEAEKRQLKEEAEAEKKQLKEKAEAEKKQLKEKAEAEKKEQAKKMLTDGISAEIAAKYSGLSVEEINEIKIKVQ